MKPKHWLPYYREIASCHWRDWRNPPYTFAGVEADFFLSAGLNCTPALQLRRHRLRICSSPLDWMMSYTLAEAAELYRTGFAAFFESIRENPYDSHSKRKIEDTANGMLSIHHFPVAMTVEEGHAYYRARAKRHFDTTHAFLSQAERYALVCKSTETPAAIAAFTSALKALYPGDPVFINVRQGTERKLETTTLPNGVTLHDFTFDDTTVLDKRGIKGRPHWGNDYEWGRVLGKCTRTARFKPPERMGKEKYN